MFSIGQMRIMVVWSYLLSQWKSRYWLSLFLHIVFELKSSLQKLNFRSYVFKNLLCGGLLLHRKKERKCRKCRKRRNLLKKKKHPSTKPCLNSKCKNVCLLKAASCVHNQCISNKAKKKEKEKCKQTDISIIDEKGKNSNDFVNIVAILLHNQKKKICSQ